MPKRQLFRAHESLATENAALWNVGTKVDAASTSGTFAAGQQDKFTLDKTTGTIAVWCGTATFGISPILNFQAAFTTSATHTFSTGDPIFRATIYANGLEIKVPVGIETANNQTIYFHFRTVDASSAEFINILEL